MKQNSVHTQILVGFENFCPLFLNLTQKKDKMSIFSLALSLIFLISKIEQTLRYNETRNYPLRGYILGVLAHTTALDQLWGGDAFFKIVYRTRANKGPSRLVAAPLTFQTKTDFLGLFYVAI